MNLRHRVLVVSVFSLGLFASVLCAQDAARTLPMQPREKEPLISYNRFGTYYPTSLNLVVPVGANDLEDTEHLELYLSMRYALYDRELSGKESAFANAWFWPDRLDLVYNARYDLYAFDGSGNYTSPLVSRDQNPGFVLSFDHRYRAKALFSDQPLLQRFELGLFHQSNGYADERTGTDLNSNGVDDGLDGKLSSSGEVADYTLANVSRDWNYVMLAATYGSYLDGKVSEDVESWWKLRAEARLFFREKDAKLWWVDVSDMPRITEYDGIRLTGEYACKLRLFGDEPKTPNFITRVELKTGIGALEDLDNLTYSASLNYRMGESNTWVNLTYFDGYGKDVTSYHHEDQFIGIGFTIR